MSKLQLLYRNIYLDFHLWQENRIKRDYPCVHLIKFTSKLLRKLFLVFLMETITNSRIIHLWYLFHNQLRKICSSDLQISKNWKINLAVWCFLFNIVRSVYNFLTIFFFDISPSPSEFKKEIIDRMMILTFLQADTHTHSLTHSHIDIR